MKKNKILGILFLSLAAICIFVAAFLNWGYYIMTLGCYCVSMAYKPFTKEDLSKSDEWICCFWHFLYWNVKKHFISKPIKWRFDLYRTIEDISNSEFNESGDLKLFRYNQDRVYSLYRKAFNKC